MSVLPQEKVTLAAITGNHPHDVPAFQQLLRALPGVDAYPQALEDWAADEGHVRDAYGALLFYNFHQAPPDDAVRGGKKVPEALAALGQRPQGLVILHHGLLCYRQAAQAGAYEAQWSAIVGIGARNFAYYPNETVSVEIANPRHPITQGLAPWQMVDETYVMPEPGAGSEILLGTSHARSMRALAWTRSHGVARVFCLVLGHDELAYTNPSFREVLVRGVRWAAGTL
jgi:hypothetical protein